MTAAFFLSLTNAAPSPAAAAAAEPQGYIDVFQDIGCVQGKGAEGEQTGLTQGGCTNFNTAFSSFRGTHDDNTQPIQNNYSHLFQLELRALSSVLRRHSLM